MKNKRGRGHLTRMRLIICLLVAGLIYGAVVIYLQRFDRITAPTLSLKSQTRADPIAYQAFKVLRSSRCDYCHASRVELPFYFRLPFVHQLMAHDRAAGLQHFRIDPVIEAFQAGKPPSVEQLSRIEGVVEHRTMPPGLYLLMHPHALLTSKRRLSLLTWISDTRRRFYATPGVAPEFAAEIIQPIPESLPVNWEKAAIGRELFFETRLSGDGTLSCSSCHGLDKAGVDNRSFSIGVNGKIGPINAPTVYNAVFNIAQFWNGRAKDLAEQASGPLFNPLEMAAPNWNFIIRTLEATPSYTDAFKAVFGSDAITPKNVTDAIAEYEKTLITPDSAFDLYLKGDAQAITAQEKRGYERFKALGCASCHSGVGVGGGGYEMMGVNRAYFDERGTPLTAADEGRFSVTHRVSDQHYFKVPSLRNVALTAPYFHDASAATLAVAVKKMALYQTPEGDISQQDLEDIVAFLKTLTGEFQGQPLGDVPSQPPLKAAELHE